jgi:acyl-CoA synthetase (AMP-forming)/AMP-acid ligase II
LTTPAITIVDVIRDRARVVPQAPALLAPGRTTLTFAMLVEAIDYAIERLHQAGFGRGDRIALALPEGPEMAVAVLAVSGCATCVPLSSELDEASYRVALEALRIDALIVGDANTSAAHTADLLGIPVVGVSFDRSGPAGVFRLVAATSRSPRGADPPASDDVALVLHTSGTVQRPKAVPLAHRMLVAPALERARQYGLGARDRCLCVRPLFTRGGLARCLFPALVVGGSVVCTPGPRGHSLVEWLAHFAPTFYSGAPAIHRALLDEIEARASVPPLALRFILSASAPLPPALAERLERTLGVPVLQGYGMTETGVVAQNPLPPRRSRVGSVGLPAGNEFTIVGDGDRPLPPNEIGEIVVRGPEVFSGYENDPAGNEQAFIDGWFRTGDLGHVDADGFLFIDGRAKELINRGGFKVSPSAVDAALLRHPEITDAITFGVPHATLGEDVVAAVVVRNGRALGASAVRDFAVRNLAAFMVPSQIVLIDDLPRSASGKVRRTDIAALLQSQLRPPFTAPRGDREALVARVFSDVLGVGSVGAFDNFFELGGDSLRGAQIVTRVNAEARTGLDVGSLFRSPTVAEFASELESAAPARAGLPPITRASCRDHADDADPATAG